MINAFKEKVNALNDSDVKDVILACDHAVMSILLSIKNKSKSLTAAIMQNNPCNIRYVKQSPELCLDAVKRDSFTLCYVKEQTPEICLAAVNDNGLALEYVKEQTPEICLAAVNENVRAIQFISEPTYNIRKMAVSENGSTLQFIKEQTNELCEIAVSTSPGSIMYIACPEMKTLEICRKAVIKDGLNIQYVPSPSAELCEIAILDNPRSLNFLKEPTMEFCELAVCTVLEKVTIDGTLIKNTSITNQVKRIRKVFRAKLEHESFKKVLSNIVKEHAERSVAKIMDTVLA